MVNYFLNDLVVDEKEVEVTGLNLTAIPAVSFDKQVGRYKCKENWMQLFKPYINWK